MAEVKEVCVCVCACVPVPYRSERAFANLSRQGPLSTHFPSHRGARDCALFQSERAHSRPPETERKGKRKGHRLPWLFPGPEVQPTRCMFVFEGVGYKN